MCKRNSEFNNKKIVGTRPRGKSESKGEKKEDFSGTIFTPFSSSCYSTSKFFGTLTKFNAEGGKRCWWFDCVIFKGGLELEFSRFADWLLSSSGGTKRSEFLMKAFRKFKGKKIACVRKGKKKQIHHRRFHFRVIFLSTTPSTTFHNVSIIFLWEKRVEFSYFLLHFPSPYSFFSSNKKKKVGKIIKNLI